jgi:hypothetical protein
MKDNPVIALFKLGKRAHMEELLHKGHVFMNTPAHYANYDDGSARFDPDENISYCQQPNGAILRVHRDAEWHTVGALNGPIRVREGNHEIANLYCLHTRRQSDYGTLLELHRLGFGDTYVLFLDAEDFLHRLKEAVTKAGHEFQYRMVGYVDRHSHSGPMGLFGKFSEFSDQRELRVTVRPGTGRPLSLHLGDLSDIAIMGFTSEKLKLEPKLAS